MRVSDIIDQFRRTTSPKVIVELMMRAADDLGFDRFAYCALTGHDNYEAGDNPAPTVAHNFPEHWIEYYFANDCLSIDPVIRCAPDIDEPFLWDRLGTNYELSSAQIRFMKQADEAGLKDGVGVPLHGARGELSLMTFAASDGHPNPAQELSMLHVLAAQFHSVYRDVACSKSGPQPFSTLTQREYECLNWIASGKCSWDIGMLMGISENTVNFHVRNMMRKLESTNRLHAVVKAIRFRIISLNSFVPPT